MSSGSVIYAISHKYIIFLRVCDVTSAQINRADVETLDSYLEVDIHRERLTAGIRLQLRTAG